MMISITPSLPKGEITAPPSKSFAHRALISAGLANGKSKICGISFSEDIKATLQCLEAIGAKININDNTAEITGANCLEKLRDVKLHCNESGSTLRFLIPICLLSSNEITLKGTEKLISRPLSVYEEIAQKQGLTFNRENSFVTVKGSLKPDIFKVNGNISSQFISGLMFALPLLQKDSEIEIISPFESKPYVQMTVDVLKRFGIEVDFNETLIKIKGNQEYKPCDITIEGDWSNAAFLYAYKMSGADVVVSGVDLDSSQGDKVCIEYFNALKNGVPTLDVADCPDLAPILFSFAAMHNGAKFTGTDRLRLKESDRISCMQEELQKFGTKVIAGNNEVVIDSKEFHAPNDIINCHNDHRIVMANTFLLCHTGGKLNGIEAVKKSYPDFFQVIEKAGVNLIYET